MSEPSVRRSAAFSPQKNLRGDHSQRLKPGRCLGSWVHARASVPRPFPSLHHLHQEPLSLLAHEKDLLTRSGPIVRWRRLGHASRLHSQSWFSRGFRYPCGHVHPERWNQPLQTPANADILASSRESCMFLTASRARNSF